MTTGRRLRAATAAVALACALALAGCSGDSGTTELSSDSADTTAPGPAPTAPGGASSGSGSSGSASAGSGVGASGSVDVNELIRRIDALNQESDLCLLLTGEALSDVTGADVNLTSLLSNPSGFTQLFASLDKLFSHMVTIGPAEVQPSLQTMQGVWKGMATIDPRAPDAETRSAALIGDPAVQSAQTALGEWVKTTCAPGAAGA